MTRYLERLRWRLIKRLVGATPPMELVGYALARAGYTDCPLVTDDVFTIHATGSQKEAV